MTEAEAREYLKNSKTPDHIADEARAVLAPINTAEAAARVEEDARAEAAAVAAEEAARATMPRPDAKGSRR